MAFCFLWVGGVPLPRFPVVLGWVGVRFFSLVLLHLASFSFKPRFRETWSTDPQPPGSARPCTWLVLPHPSLVGSCQGDEPSARAGGDRGVCDPAHLLGAMVVITIFARGSPHVGLSPHRMGILFSLPLGSCIVSLCQKGCGKEISLGQCSGSCF